MTANGGDKIRDYNKGLSKHLGGYQEVLNEIQILLDKKLNNLETGIFYSAEEKIAPIAVIQLKRLKEQFI